MKFNKFLPYVYLILIVTIFVGLVIVNLNIQDKYTFPDYFASSWVAANLWINEGTSPYNEIIVTETNKLLDKNGSADFKDERAGFMQPAFNLFLFLPLGFLDYSLARAVWLLLLEISVFMSVYISLKLSGWEVSMIEKLLIFIFFVLWYPFLRGILFGDKFLIYTFVVIFTAWLAQKDNGTAAGFLLALTLGTVEISILIAIFLIVWRISRSDYSMLVSYLSGVAFFILVSVLLIPGWLKEWFQLILITYSDFSFINSPLMLIGNVFKGASLVINLVLHIVVIFYLLLEWFGALGKAGRVIQWKNAITLALVFMINIFSRDIYVFFLLPGFLLVLRFISERWKNFGKILSWFLILALVLGSWLLLQKTATRTNEEPIYLVSLLFPLFTVAGLNWIRWWALKRPSPLLE